MNPESALNGFHPVVRDWFRENIGTPSLPQMLGWPVIQSGKNVLISAPTGAGKTLAAFLESIDNLLKKGLEGNLPEGVFILYVSPLKALNNDICKNLDIPLEGIKKYCINAGISFPDIRKAVRTGDTPQNERQKILKNPPHILITTPETLFLMLTSKKASDCLKNVRYIIVDEIHTMLGTKRGVHLALSIERLQRLAQQEIVRIGLSATIHPIEAAACYLGGLRHTGGGRERRPVTIVAPPMERSKDLKIHLPVPDYRVLEEGTIWPEIFDSIYRLVKQHRSTIVFVNNRAVAERVAANLNSMDDEPICRPHHGSLSKSNRLEVEEKFKSGDLKCIIATSTLELGIDIGSVDLMIQVASPLTVASGLQRLGRAGHRLDAASIGRIIPKTMGDLVKSAFIAGEMMEGHIEQEKIPKNCLDILSQHIVSMSCGGRRSEEDMLSVIRNAWSYQDLKESDFKNVLAMLAGDYEHNDDIPAKPRIFWDRRNKTVEGTAYSRMLAVSSSGTIPDRGYFPVVLEDCRTRIGELDEVFVFEARAGDRFMLGNSAWKIVKIEKNRVIVTPASSMGAKTPFWQGDGIGSPYEQGTAYGRFLKELAEHLDKGDFIDYLVKTSLMDETAALNIRNYLTDQKEIIGCLSHDRRIVVEYLKDDMSGQKIIIHAHFGGRVNSVLALLIQKALEDSIRCQTFASHSNDAVLIHIYGCPDPLSNVLSLLNPQNVESVLLKMLPSTSRFAMAFRYNAYRALMMGVRNSGQRLPLWIQRLRSVDALENARKTMDHPLIVETMRECLEEIFDIPNAIRVLKDIQKGTIEIVEKHSLFPSPFASELLFEFKSIMMYAEKSPHPGEPDGPLISGIDALSLSFHHEGGPEPISPAAVADVIAKQNAPMKLQNVSSPSELHSFMLIYGDASAEEAGSPKIQEWLDILLKEKRALRLEGQRLSTPLYIAVEECGLYAAALDLQISGLSGETFEGAYNAGVWTQDEAVSRIIRRYTRYHSPFQIEDLENRYQINPRKIEQILHGLKSEGLLVKGRLALENAESFCHIKIYESIVRKSGSLKAQETAAQAPSGFASFVPVWQKTGNEALSPETSLYEAIKQLEGLCLPFGWWETIVFPARVKGYGSAQLDRLCASGKVFWRVKPNPADKTPTLAWYCVENFAPSLEPLPEPETALSDIENTVLRILKQKGASFAHVLTALTGIQPGRLMEVLEELVMKGLVVNDSFMPIRYFLDKGSAGKKVSDREHEYMARRIALAVSKPDMGRWEAAWPVAEKDINKTIDRWFSRYGLLSKEILSIETSLFSWNEIYEALKVREYAGAAVRGYFVQGLSGIQFMLPEAFRRLGLEAGMQVLNACDPAQIYGKILPRTEDMLPFTNIPGTALVCCSGKPVLVLERYGEKIIFPRQCPVISEALQAFKQAFMDKRIWPDRKRIMVKYWPEDEKERDILQAALKEAGFKNEVLKMVLYRS